MPNLIHVDWTITSAGALGPASPVFAAAPVEQQLLGLSASTEYRMNSLMQSSRFAKVEGPSFLRDAFLDSPRSPLMLPAHLAVGPQRSLSPPD